MMDALSPQLEQNMLMFPAWDKELFGIWTAGLPDQLGENGTGKYADGTPIPYSSGPHIVQCLRSALAITDTECPSVLEIGFNRGHSAACFLGLDPFCTVTSLDVVSFIEQKTACKVLRDRFCLAAPRHSFYLRSDFDLLAEDLNTIFSLAFINGAHDEMSILTDIDLCYRLAIPWLLFDDWYPRWGETQAAVDTAQFKIEAVLGGMALCRFPIDYTY